MERIRPPFGKVMKRAIHTGETFSLLGETCSIGSKADVGAWVPAESGTVGAEGNLPLLVSYLGCCLFTGKPHFLTEDIQRCSYVLRGTLLARTTSESPYRRD